MKKGFTLAEVLITLAIIGVVAALTIPTLITNYQKKMYVTGLKKEYSNITNGLKAYMANEGVTQLSETTLWSKIKDVGSLDHNTIYYRLNLKEEFEKIFKILVLFDPDNMENYRKYNVPVNYLSGNTTNIAYLFFLADGSNMQFSFFGAYDKAYCGGKPCTSLKEFQETKNTPTKFWDPVGYITIDVNGIKKPNTYGRDIFRFEIGNDGVLYPHGGKDYAVYAGCNYNNLNSCATYWTSTCNISSANSGLGCAGRVIEEGWEMNY